MAGRVRSEEFRSGEAEKRRSGEVESENRGGRERGIKVELRAGVKSANGKAGSTVAEGIAEPRHSDTSQTLQASDCQSNQLPLLSRFSPTGSLSHRRRSFQFSLKLLHEHTYSAGMEGYRKRQAHNTTSGFLFYRIQTQGSFVNLQLQCLHVWMHSG